MGSFDDWLLSLGFNEHHWNYENLKSSWNAALDAAAKVAREWNWRISTDDICQDCSNVASEEIAAAIERLKE
jgi:hypothetical protein